MKELLKRFFSNPTADLTREPTPPVEVVLDEVTQLLTDMVDDLDYVLHYMENKRGSDEVWMPRPYGRKHYKFNVGDLDYALVCEESRDYSTYRLNVTYLEESCNKVRPLVYATVKQYPTVLKTSLYSHGNDPRVDLLIITGLEALQVEIHDHKEQARAIKARQDAKYAREEVLRLSEEGRLLDEMVDSLGGDT